MAQFTTEAGIDGLTGKFSKHSRLVMRQKEWHYPDGRIFGCVFFAEVLCFRLIHSRGAQARNAIRGISSPQRGPLRSYVRTLVQTTII